MKVGGRLDLQAGTWKPPISEAQTDQALPDSAAFADGRVLRRVVISIRSEFSTTDKVGRRPRVQPTLPLILHRLPDPLLNNDRIIIDGERHGASNP